MGEARFSILTPTKDRPELLLRAVGSVLAQSFTDWELIVLDNGESVKALLPDDPRIRYFHEEAVSAADAFNRALGHATGEIVTPLADDDVLTPKALATVDRCIGDADWIYANTSFEQNDQRLFTLGAPFDIERLRHEYYLGGAVYWRKALTDKLGGFNTTLSSAADYDLYLRFAEHTAPRYVAEVLYRYNDHEQTDSRVNAGRQALQTLRIAARPTKAPTNVTVVIPFLNGGNEEWLHQAVCSVPVGTPLIVAENDGQLADALNGAFRDADTEFVFRLDADDALLPDTLDWMLGPAWNADVVYPNMILVNEDESEVYGTHPAEPFCGNRMLEMNYVSGAALMRRESVLKVGGFREMRELEDWDLWVRMFRAGMRFKPCPQASMVYRQHDSSRNKRVRSDVRTREDARDAITGARPELLATFYAQTTPATTYLRCQLPARYLPGAVQTNLFAYPDGDDVTFSDHRGGAAVFQYAADKARALTMLTMQRQGVRVLLEADDNYLLHPGKRILEASGWSMGHERPNSRDGHRWIAGQADGVIVTTEWLAAQYRKVNPNVFVCPNTVDPVDWPDPVKPDDGILRIVWAASPSHRDDIPLVTAALEWASRQKDVEVYAAGMDPKWRFPHGRVPWADDLDIYRHNFKHFDIGVAPVKAQPFSLGRSDVKATEYGMGLCAPVLSDVACYEDWTDGDNCLKARDAAGFKKTIQHLVRNRGEVPELAAAARGFALEHRTTESQIGKWKEAVAG
jgi:glycosyltransferase involved in cell wall biosynthesis